MNLKQILTFLSILFFSNFYGQSVFSGDSEKFLKELQSYLGNIKSKDAKDFAKELLPIWEQADISNQVKSLIYATGNQIVLEKRKAYPDFKDYITATLYAAHTGMSESDFMDWHVTVEKALLEKNKSRFTSYIHTCAILFKEQLIYKSASTSWKAEERNYTFSFDKQPVIKFDNMKLICYAKNDSSVIYNTKGEFYPYSNKWMGDGGTITWQRVDLPTNLFFAEFDEYRISMKSPGFSVDSARFHSKYFNEPILGKLSEKVLSKRSLEQVEFPKFQSYDNRLEIKEIFPNADYEGGFKMEGLSLLGSGTFDDPSRLTFYHKEKPFMTVEDIIIVINDNTANASRGRVNIMIEEDSIFHPGVYFQYNNKEGNQQITLTRGDGITAAPFNNSYHKLDMYSEALYWNVGDPIIKLSPLFGSTDTTSEFISYDYFSQDDYLRLSGMGSSPLVQLKNKSNQLASNKFTTRDAASALLSSEDDAKPLLYELMTMGYLTYNEDRDEVILQDKLFNNIKQGAKKMDSDNIKIISSSKTNAELSLVSLDLKLNGVTKFPLSITQRTLVYPKQQEITIKKNRDMTFSGAINVGRTEFFGSQFNFDYEDFKIQLIACDSMRLRGANQAADGPPEFRLTSKIESIAGDIQIDGKTNKSGRFSNKLPQFPVLNSTKKSYVYYDAASIQKGAYKREDFKFIIEPFKMDSLDNFSNRGVGFEGEFISAGIFPNMDETLVLQEDLSLGFKRKAPEGGIGIYGKKANYENEIRLSNKGLQGSGDIDFLSSHAESLNITFLPDSVTAIAEVYYNTPSEDDPAVPEVSGSNIYVSYIPARKVLYASSYEANELKMFADSAASMDGRIALKPDGLTGAGTIYIENGEVLSNLFKFKHHVFDADTSEFKLRTVDLAEMAFKTENVSAHVDFSDRKGQFKSNEGESSVEFPENQYICYMDQFNWLMDQDDLEMESKGRAGDVNIDTDLDLAGSNFFSIHPDQDSLSFKSPKAKFDVRKKKITCQKVEYVTTADARVSPIDGIVIIKRKAKMEPFEKATILVNYITKYHNIFDADVEIFAKNDYKASGYYNYVDAEENQQKFYFSNIKPDTTNQTTAKGAVKESSNFKLSPQFDYYGEIEMFASFKELTFKGATRLSAHDCEGIERNWMSFEAKIDPENIQIPVNTEMFDLNGGAIGAGLVLNTDEIGLYSTFLSKKLSPKHINVMTASGLLMFDKKTNEYRIAPKEKLAEINLPGNFVSLSTNDCKLFGDGQFDFGAELGLVGIEPVGRLAYEPKAGDLSMTASIRVDFPFNYDAMDKMAKQFEDYFDLPPLDFNNSTYEKSLREFVGMEKSDKIISDLNIYGKIKGKLPDSLLVPLYLADVQMKWDSDKNAFVSDGKIGVATSMKNQIFKQVDGYVAVYKKPTGDEVSILLQLDEKTYYFFNYKRGLFQAYSTNEDFNNVILETKKDKTKFKAPKGQDDFQFMLSSKTKAVAFKRQFED